MGRGDAVQHLNISLILSSSDYLCLGQQESSVIETVQFSLPPLNIAIIFKVSLQGWCVGAYFPTRFLSLSPVDQNLITLDLYFEILYSQEVEFQNFNRYMLDSVLDKDSL